MLTLSQILRASHVSRWNIVNTIKHQSVAEHTFNVCMIARALCKRLAMDDDNLIKAVLEHDLDEVIFGDIPTPMKEKMAKRGVNINMIVDHQTRNLSEIETIVMKVADLTEAIWFLQDHGVGRHAVEVEMDIRDRLDRYLETHKADIGDGNMHTITTFVEQVVAGQI
jgi:hypothetical protein